MESAVAKTVGSRRSAEFQETSVQNDACKAWRIACKCSIASQLVHAFSSTIALHVELIMPSCCICATSISCVPFCTSWCVSEGFAGVLSC